MIQSTRPTRRKRHNTSQGVQTPRTSPWLRPSWKLYRPPTRPPVAVFQSRQLLRGGEEQLECGVAHEDVAERRSSRIEETGESLEEEERHFAFGFA